MSEEAKLAVSKPPSSSKYDLELADWVHHPFTAYSNNTVPSGKLVHMLATPFLDCKVNLEIRSVNM